MYLTCGTVSEPPCTPLSQLTNCWPTTSICFKPGRNFSIQVAMMCRLPPTTVSLATLFKTNKTAARVELLPFGAPCAVFSHPPHHNPLKLLVVGSGRSMFTAAVNIHVYVWKSFRLLFRRAAISFYCLLETKSSKNQYPSPPSRHLNC